jgi:hypothetical protein
MLRLTAWWAAWIALGVAAVAGAVIVVGLPTQIGAALTRADIDPWSEPVIPRTAGHAVVVAELFTSEGCSSCPPADDVLSRLILQQPVPNVDVLGLSEHVDYWDHLGWRDPFSSPAASARQSEYVRRVFHSDSIYTPQLVIDGRFEVVGSDVRNIRRTIARAASVPKAQVEVAAASIEGGYVRVGVHVQAAMGAPREKAYVLLAVAQNHAANDVRRGENGGRLLHHSAVVRSLTALDSMAGADQTFTATTTVPIAPEWAHANLRVIALVQEQQSRRIVGAGAASVATDRETR